MWINQGFYDDDFDRGEVNMPELLARLPESQRAEMRRLLQEMMRREKQHREEWQSQGNIGDAESVILSERKARIESKLSKRLGVPSIDFASGNN